jgi:hypothetical protein
MINARRCIIDRTETAGRLSACDVAPVGVSTPIPALGYNFLVAHTVDVANFLLS